MLSTLKDIDLKGKKVFLRVDFNVPFENGQVSDDTRIKEALPTIKYIVDKGAFLTLGTHFGRPKGEKNIKYSVKPIVDYINSKKYFNASFVNDCIGEVVISAQKNQSQHTVIVLENLRFYPGEEANDSSFVNSLSSNYDVYVNDAFGTCHRKHASVYGMPLKMSTKAAGFLIEKEVKYFDKIVNNPDKPFAAILGGAKVSDKIGVIKSLLNKADIIVIGGAMAYTFLKYKGVGVGKSLVEEDFMSTVGEVIDLAKKKGVEIFLPIDHIVSKEFGGKAEYCENEWIEKDYMGLDIGPKTINLYEQALASVKTVLWNGPMGVFEKEDYSKGTFAVAKFLANLGVTVVVGGGDSVSAINKAGVAPKISHISTGGGASLEYLEYGTLPGIEVLQQ